MDYRVYTVTNESILESGDPSAWSYSSRSQINPETNLPYMDEDLYMHSRFPQRAIIYIDRVPYFHYEPWGFPSIKVGPHLGFP